MNLDHTGCNRSRRVAVENLNDLSRVAQQSDSYARLKFMLDLLPSFLPAWEYGLH